MPPKTVVYRPRGSLRANRAIREAGVLFEVEYPPTHGRRQVSVRVREGDTSRESPYTTSPFCTGKQHNQVILIDI
jgi:hypothetical protein